MSYKIILFDLDGTLTDSKIGITKSVRYALNKLGSSEGRTDKFVSWIGSPLWNSFKKYYAFNDDKTRKAIDLYREYYSKKGMLENTIFDGIKEMIQKLYDEKKILFVVTLKPVPFADEVMEHFGLRKYFKQIIAPDLELENPSKEKMISEIFKEYPEEDKKNYIMVGDRDQDIFAAHNIGIDSVGVLWGYGTKDEITKADPTYIAHSVKELAELLK